MTNRIRFFDSLDPPAFFLDVGDWELQVRNLVQKRETRRINNVSYELGVKFVDPSCSDYTLPLNKDSMDEFKKNFLANSLVDYIYVVACIPIRLFYFGEGVGSTSKKELIAPNDRLGLSADYSFMYKGNMNLEQFMKEVVIPTLFDHEVREKKYQLVVKPTKENQELKLQSACELRFQANVALVRDESLLLSLDRNKNTVFIRPTHVSYSHTTSLIMQNFTYPGIDHLVQTDTPPADLLNILTTAENANELIQSNISRYASSRAEATAAHLAQHGDGTLC